MTGAAGQLLKRIKKRAKKGARGYPVGTLAFYGPDDRRASKMVAAIVDREAAEPSSIQKWQSETGNVREDPVMLGEVLTFFEEHRAMSVVMSDRIIGRTRKASITRGPHARIAVTGRRETDGRAR